MLLLLNGLGDGSPPTVFLLYDYLDSGMKIESGDTDNLIYFVAIDPTDFKTRETGLTGFTVFYSRNGGAATAYTTPTINEVDSTNMPGVYTLLLDEGTTIDSSNDTEEYAIHIAQASMLTVTRTIELYRSVWEEGSRTLTQPAAAVAGVVSGDMEITVYRGTKWTITISGITTTGMTKAWFTVKTNLNDPDGQSLVQINSDDGLTVINGAVAATSGDGSVTIGSGEITIVLEPAASSVLTPDEKIHWDVKAIVSGSVNLISDGVRKFNLRSDVTRTYS